MNFPDSKISVELYRTMLKIRLAEERIVQIYPSDKIQSPVHLSVGQEGVSAGVCLAMDAPDRIYGTYRSHGLYIARSGDLKKMFAELYGKDSGCARGKGGSMHLAAPEAGLMACSAVVASTIPVATGNALASKLRGTGRVIVSFFGDGGMDEGVFFESVNFAVLKSLPIVYVIENNGYGIHSKLSDRRKQTDLFRVTEGLGLSGRRIDGDDVFAVYESMREALDRSRKGGGPQILEYTTHRWKEHVGIGDDFNQPYRTPNEEKIAKESDPVKRAREVLGKKFNLKDAEMIQWEKEILAEIDEAVRFAESARFPSADRLMEDLYA